MTGVSSGGVMHVITGLGVGGAETMLASLAQAEAAAGQPPVVVSLTLGGPIAAPLEEAGIEVFDLGMVRGLPPPGALFKLRSLIRRFRPAVLQSWMYHANLMATGALSLSGLRRKTVHYWGIRCSDMDLDAYGWMFRAVVKAGGLFSAWPDAVTCNSEAGIAVHKALGYNPRRFLLVDNGIDIARFAPDPAARDTVRAEFEIAPETVVIATAARVDPMKDYANLLAALDQLPDVTAIVMGDGTEMLPDTPGLIRLGRCDRVAQVFAAADLIVSASAYGEGFSNAIAEGMACGLPAVATDVGDARRIVGDAGTIVEPRNSAILAAAIDALSRRPDRAEMGRAARERIEMLFSLERSVAHFRKLHREGI